MQQSRPQVGKILEDMEFDPRTMGGSIKRKIMNPDLLEERAKCDFDQIEAYRTIFDENQRKEFDIYHRMVEKYPQITPGIDTYGKDRIERFQEWWERFALIMGDEEFNSLFTQNSRQVTGIMPWHYCFAGTNPMTYHLMMFVKAVAQLGSES